MELLLDCSSTCLVGSILFLAAVLAGYLVSPSTQKDVSNSTPITRVLPRNRSESLCLSPLRLRKLVLKNRVVRAAAFGGATVNDLIDTHTAVARGGAAMTTIAYASVSNDGRTFSSQLLLSDEALAPELERLSAAVHEAGAAISIQLTHAGSFADRKVTGEQQVAPSRLFNPAGFDFPREMTEVDMARVARQFGDAASLVKRAGFDAVEVHMGHGYLLSQFLCPFTNRRADRHGGIISNRLRFPIQVIEHVRAAVGQDFPVLVKMNMHDGFDGGITLPDAAACARAFALASADALVLSGGFTSRNGFFMLRGKTPLWAMAKAMGLFSVKGLAVLLFGRWLVPEVPFEEAFFRDYARAILRELRCVPADSSNGALQCKVCLLGGLSSFSAVEGALADGFDFVQMARALIHDPALVRRYEQVLSASSIEDDDRQRCGGDIEDIVSGCTHCNHCVVATLDPTAMNGCILTHK